MRRLGRLAAAVAITVATLGIPTVSAQGVVPGQDAGRPAAGPRVVEVTVTTYLPVGSSPDVEADRVGVDGWPQTTKPPAVPCEVQAYKAVHSYRFPNLKQANKVLSVFRDGVLTRAENKQAARHRVGMDIVARPVQGCPQPDLHYHVYLPDGARSVNSVRDIIGDDGWPQTSAEPTAGYDTYCLPAFSANYLYRPTSRQATAQIEAAFADGVLTREEADAIRPWQLSLDVIIRFRCGSVQRYSTYLPVVPASGTQPDAELDLVNDAWPQTQAKPDYPCGVQTYRADWVSGGLSPESYNNVHSAFADGVLTLSEYGTIADDIDTLDVVALPVTPCGAGGR